MASLDQDNDNKHFHMQTQNNDSPKVFSVFLSNMKQYFINSLSTKFSIHEFNISLHNKLIIYIWPVLFIQSFASHIPLYGSSWLTWLNSTHLIDCCVADDFIDGCFVEYALTFLLADVGNLGVWDFHYRLCYLKSRIFCRFKCSSLICQHG